MVVCLRMPEAWRGISDQQLVAWLRDSFRRSFRLSKNEERLIEHVLGGDVNSFLRRLIALHLGLRAAVPARRKERAPASPRAQLTRPIVKQDGIARGPVKAAENRPAPVHEVPPLLSQPCEGNGYSPMWRDGQWIRMARTAEEERVYGEFMDARFREDQRRRHA